MRTELRRFARWLFLTGALSLPAVSASATIFVPFGPPAPVFERRPASPGRAYVWRPGFYRWGGRRYVWVGGAWMRPPHSRARWVPGRWTPTRRGYRWRSGRWTRGPRVRAEITRS